MKSKIKICVMAVLLIATLLSFSACGLFGDNDRITITFNANGGSSVQAKDIKTGNTLDNAPSSSKTGYIFEGWFIDDSSFTVSIEGYKFDSNTTVFAKWTVEEYVITYILGDGENNPQNPVSYTIESSEIKILPPTKDGFAFDGWKEGDVIASGSVGEKIFTAKWIIADGSSIAQAFPIFIEIPSVEVDEIDENGKWFRVDLENDAPIRLEIISENPQTLSAELYSQTDTNSAIITSSNQEWDVVSRGRYYIKISSAGSESGAVLLSLPPVIEFDEQLNSAQVDYASSIWRTLMVEEDHVLMANSETSKDTTILVYEPNDLSNEVLYADYLGYNSLQKGKYYVRIETLNPNNNGLAILNFCTDLVVDQSVPLSLEAYGIKWYKLTLTTKQAVEICMSGDTTLYAVLYSSLDIENEIMLIENSFAMTLDQGDYFFKVFANQASEGEFAISSCLLLENGISNDISYGALTSGNVFWGRFIIDETVFFTRSEGFGLYTQIQYFKNNEMIPGVENIPDLGEYFVRIYSTSTSISTATFVINMTPITDIPSIALGQTISLSLDAGASEFYKLTIANKTRIYPEFVNTNSILRAGFYLSGENSSKFVFATNAYPTYVLDVGTYIIRLYPSYSGPASGTFAIKQWNDGAEKNLILGSYIDNTSINGKVWYNLQLDEDAIVRFDSTGYLPEQILIFKAGDTDIPILTLNSLSDYLNVVELKTGSYKICGIVSTDRVIRMRVNKFDLDQIPSLSLGVATSNFTVNLPLSNGYAISNSSLVLYKFTLEQETTIWHNLIEINPQFGIDCLVFDVVSIANLTNDLIGTNYGNMRYNTRTYSSGTYLVYIYVTDYFSEKSNYTGNFKISVLTPPQSSTTVAIGETKSFTVNKSGLWFKFSVPSDTFVDLYVSINSYGKVLYFDQNMKPLKMYSNIIFVPGTYYVFAWCTGSNSDTGVFQLKNNCNNISLNNATEVKSPSYNSYKLVLDDEITFSLYCNIPKSIAYICLPENIPLLMQSTFSAVSLLTVNPEDLITLPKGTYYLILYTPLGNFGEKLTLNKISKVSLSVANSYSISSDEKIYSLHISERTKISLLLNQTVGNVIVAIFSAAENFNENILVLSFADSGSLYLDEGDYFIVIASYDGIQASGSFILSKM